MPNGYDLFLATHSWNLMLKTECEKDGSLGLKTPKSGNMYEFIIYIGINTWLMTNKFNSVKQSITLRNDLNS